ncbi:glycosyl transferase, partial [Candidatus Falkowbacteria bacterium CG10_big_fil_rev_8_21_14_0_10_37_6]
MNIALVHDHLAQLGGAERTLKSLSKALPQAPIYTLLYNQQNVENFFHNTKIKA